MPKPGGCHSSGISLGDVLRLPKRHPAWRRREAQSGSCTERENLAGDAKGKGASGSNREAESTDAPERGGLPCSSDEAGVMLVERRGQVTDVGSEPTGNRRSSNSRRKAAAFVRWHEPDDARVSSPDLCEARGEIPRPTRPFRTWRRCLVVSAHWGAKRKLSENAGTTACDPNETFSR
jgi:hypothetical protein